MLSEQIKGMKWFIVIACVIGVMVGAEKLGFFDWFAETEYGWIITDQANPYIDKEVYHNAPAEHKVRWWLSVMDDPERRYFAKWEGDGVYHWDKIEKIYLVHEGGGYDRDTLYKVLLVAAKEGTFDKHGGDGISKETDIASLNRDKFAVGDERGYVVMGNKLVSLTKLNEHGMEIQEVDGCTACHEKK